LNYAAKSPQRTWVHGSDPLPVAFKAYSEKVISVR